MIDAQSSRRLCRQRFHAVQAFQSSEVGAILLSLLLAMNADGTSSASWRCRAKPIALCSKHHGRLSSQTGIALKIWLIGTNRTVAVDNDSDEEIPLAPGLIKKIGKQWPQCGNRRMPA